MIAAVNDLDITVYLDGKEPVQLGSETLQGVLIHWRKPTEQGILSVSVNDELARKNGGHSGVGVDFANWGKEPTRLELFMCRDAYETFLAKGKLGIGYGCSARDVCLYDLTRADTFAKITAENLMFYRDNRERLSQELNRNQPM